MKWKCVQDLKVGDRVDLKTCPYLSISVPNIADNLFGVVGKVTRETPDCIAIWYDDIDCVGYPVDTELLVEESWTN